MDMDFNGDMASLDAEILQLPEVSPLGIKTNPHVAEKLFDQWLSLLDTVSLDDGILVIPIVADSPPKLRTKKGLAVEFHDRVYALLTIATMSGGCQVDTMIIQAISLLDDLEKELNKYAMGVREWYGWHFPELTKIVQDNIIYAKTVKLMA